MNFSLGAIAQYGALVRQCQKLAVRSLTLAIWFVAIVIVMAFLKEAEGQIVVEVVELEKAMGWALIVGLLGMFFLVLAGGGAFDWLINWILRPSVCKCGSTEFRFQPGWEEKFTWEPNSFAVPPSECARCGQPKLF